PGRWTGPTGDEPALAAVRAGPPEPVRDLARRHGLQPRGGPAPGGPVLPRATAARGVPDRAGARQPPTGGGAARGARRGRSGGAALLPRGGGHHRVRGGAGTGPGRRRGLLARLLATLAGPGVRPPGRAARLPGPVAAAGVEHAAAGRRRVRGRAGGEPVAVSRWR